MAMPNTRLQALVDRLIAEGKLLIGTQFDASEPYVHYSDGRPVGVDLQKFSKWTAGCENLLRMLGDAGVKWGQSFANPKNGLYNTIRMLGVLEAISEVMQHGLLLSVEDLVRAEAFESLLSQADYLFAEGFFLAAGVLGRAVLEEHLRKWCEVKACLPEKPKPTLNDFNVALYKARAITLVEMKQIEGLIAIGNEAAHNLPTLTSANAGRLLREVREVLVRHPMASV